jgi:hypothetical protein
LPHFFALGDGGALAFFQYADQDEHPVDLNSPGHIAFECDAETQQGIKERLEPTTTRCASPITAIACHCT